VRVGWGRRVEEFARENLLLGVRIRQEFVGGGRICKMLTSCEGDA